MVDFLLIKNNLFKGLEALLRLHALCYLEGNLLAIPVFFSLEECLVTLPTLSFLESLLMIRQEFSHLRKIWRLPGTSLMADYLRQKTFFFFDLILLGPPMFFVMRYIMHTGDFWVLHELPLFVLMAWLEFNVGEPCKYAKLNIHLYVLLQCWKSSIYMRWLYFNILEGCTSSFSFQITEVLNVELIWIQIHFFILTYDCITTENLYQGKLCIKLFVCIQNVASVFASQGCPYIFASPLLSKMRHFYDDRCLMKMLFWRAWCRIRSLSAYNCFCEAYIIGVVDI